MEKLSIVKAGKVGDKAPSDLTIEFSGEPPEIDHSLPFQDFLTNADNWYNQQAIALGDVLIRTLPGGTLDRLICFLLRQKASYFRVPHVDPPKDL